MTYSQSWDLKDFYPNYGGPEYTSHWAYLEKTISDFKAQIVSNGALTESSAADWADFYDRLEHYGLELGHMSSYLGCLSSADALNDDYKRDLAKLSAFSPQIEEVMEKFQLVLGQAEERDFEALLAQPKTKDLRYNLTRLRTQARRKMPLEQEMLASELDVNGLSAWSRLYDSVSGKLKFELKTSKGTRTVPFAQKRTLLEDNDPEVRLGALRDSNAAIAEIEDVFASALNAIAGTRHTLYARRGIKHFLEPAMWSGACDQSTIETMYDVVRARAEVPRAYLRRKAKVLGVKQLGFQDLDAPLPLKDSGRFEWNQGCEMVLKSFADSYPALHKYSQMALQKSWIESAPSDRKRPGGFCTGSDKVKQQRIFMTYGGSLGDIQTLAHELGHAFHSWTMRELHPARLNYPMTLAETASTFAQTIVAQALAKDPSLPSSVHAQMLTTLLNDGATFCLDIQMRYEFEKRFYEARKAGELSASELKALMVDVQKEVFGDSLDPEQLDPYFWASKLHFYIGGLSFYNFPYSFGYLLSRALLARFREEGPSFLPKYEKLLMQSASATCEDAVRDSIGADIRRPEFWHGALDEIEGDLKKFETLKI